MSILIFNCFPKLNLGFSKVLFSRSFVKRGANFSPKAGRIGLPVSASLSLLPCFLIIPPTIFIHEINSGIQRKKVDIDLNSIFTHYFKMNTMVVHWYLIDVFTILSQIQLSIVFMCSRFRLAQGVQKLREKRESETVFRLFLNNINRQMMDYRPVNLNNSLI